MGFIDLPRKNFTTTWSTRPSASSMNGKIIRVSDLGNGSALFISNGTRWQPLGGTCLLVQNNTASTVTGTAVETTLATITIPAGLMSSNGIIEVSSLWSCTNAATSRNIRGRFGAGAVSFLSSTITTSNTIQSRFYLRNQNSLSSQSVQPVGFVASYGTSTSSYSTFGQDTSIDFNITLSGTLTDTSQFITLEAYTVFYSEG